MLAAAAVCPCPPLLVPEVAAGAAAELGDLRAACADALSVLAAARPDRLVVVGPVEGPDLRTYPQGATGSFRAVGVDRSVRLGPGEPPAGDVAGVAELPPALAVGGWLLERAAWGSAPVEGIGAGESLAPERCAAAGRELAGTAERVALLVLGDGSACRTVKAPGYLDERATGFDAGVARALAAADTAALAALDREPAASLLAAGRAPWQVLAGAGEKAGLAGRLLYEDAPYGVGYFVAVWS